MRHPSVLDVERSDQGRFSRRLRAVGGESSHSDADAFAGIYQRHFREVYGYCWNRLRQQQAAEDAAGQVFLQAFQGMSRYEETGRSRGWLFSIAHNVVVSHLRRERPTDS